MFWGRLMKNMKKIQENTKHKTAKHIQTNFKNERYES